MTQQFDRSGIFQGDAPRRHGASAGAGRPWRWLARWGRCGAPAGGGLGGVSAGHRRHPAPPATAGAGLHVGVDALHPPPPLGGHRGPVGRLLPARWEPLWGLLLATAPQSPHGGFTPRCHRPGPMPKGSRHGPGRPQACSNHGNVASLHLRPQSSHGNQVLVPLSRSLAPSGRVLQAAGCRGGRRPWGRWGSRRLLPQRAAAASD